LIVEKLVHAIETNIKAAASSRPKESEELE
jgi:hypothetical protein